MKNFLVPIDFSAVTDQVIDETVSLARACGGKVNLLNVVQPPAVATAEYALPVEVIQEALNVTDKAAREKLAKYAGKYTEAGIACETEVLVGQPVALILEQAAKVHADYIVMGSHGHGKLYDFLVGSTASGILKKTKCGVIILPSEGKHR
jgi:nucleotide-binding universal stress UspA family protein